MGADKEKTDLVFAIDQPASVPANEDEMAKQIIRQMMNSLQSQTSGTEDKDVTELVNGINQQMTNILQAQMAGALDQHTSPVIRMKEQIMRLTDEPVNDDQEEEDKSQMKDILQAQMSGMADEDRTGLVNVLDQHAQVHITSTSPGIKINRRAKDIDEKATKIMRQLMNILQGIMSGMTDKDRTNSRAKDQDEKVMQIMRRMMDILQAMMSGIADKEKTDLVFAIDQPASVPANEDEMA